MRYFQDTGVLLLYGLFALLYKDVDIAFVFGFLCALILLCFAWFIEVRWLCLAGGIVFTAVGLAGPSVGFFFPPAGGLFFRADGYVLGGACIFF